ncbi:MAG TPA: aspartate ammonia-lyase [Nitrososphaeraceae archaeon]|jgi:aspartate ammonia-lyase|nr:aspartate ammonia-lyase [Nitrososphaeraceae archaeon]
MSGFRIDRDSLGEVKVPYEAYYGPFTVRASSQYNVTGQKAHPDLVKAYAMIKKCAALSNRELGGLSEEISNAIIKACDKLLSGELLNQIIIEPINSGAGTAFNMNINEVIANMALETLGEERGKYDRINPNDHVNMSQSSNDTFPTAMHLSILLGLNNFLAAIDLVIASLKNKSAEFKDIIKIGRTHLMDALPITLGDEFSGYYFSIETARQKIVQASENLYGLALGGTAVGTGANSPEGYRELSVRHLQEISRLEVKPAANLYFALQSRFDIACYSSSIKNLAAELIKLANDLRLMASGPTAGLAEIVIPAVHAGSSIMPGKINPSLAECLNMICFNVIGNDLAVTMASQAGQLELNVMLPGILKWVLESMDMLTNFLPVFASNFIDGIQANGDKLSSYVYKSPVLVTILNPYIGYVKASEIYKKALKTNRDVKDIVVQEGLMKAEDAERVFSRANLIGKRQET